jgi:hypothetical protein
MLRKVQFESALIGKIFISPQQATRIKGRVVGVVLVIGLLLALSVSLLSFSNAAAGARTFTATLSGWNEVPSTIISKGFGFAKVTISEDEKSIEYELVYYGLVNVTAAHIHLGKDGHVGGVAVWLCGGPKPKCPPSGTRISGKITAEDVMAIETQGLKAGDLSSLIAAIRSGSAYVNVHTTAYPAGEIRGQLAAP